MNSLISRGSLFDDFFRDMSPGFYFRPLHGDGLPSPSQIKMDVKENGSAYTVEAEIPGVSKDDIQVDIEGGVVTVRAEVKQEDSKTEGGKLLSRERYYGAVSRSIALPQEVDAAKAKAKYESGVLKLTLPRKEGALSRQLRIE